VPFVSLIGPGVGLALVSLTNVFRSGRAPMGWRESVELFAASYAAGVSVSLYLERYFPAGARSTRRIVEALSAAVGFAAALALLSILASSRRWVEAGLGLSTAVAAAGLLVPERSDRVRALVLAVMAVAALRWPPVIARPPFISLSIFWGALALGCAIGDRPRRTVIRRLFSVGVLAGLVCAAFGVYMLEVEYALGSPVGLLLGGAIVIMGAGGSVVIVVCGTWPERQARQRRH
jgi:hypothetical protein